MTMRRDRSNWRRLVRGANLLLTPGNREGVAGVTLPPQGTLTHLARRPPLPDLLAAPPPCLPPRPPGSYYFFLNTGTDVATQSSKTTGQNSSIGQAARFCGDGGRDGTRFGSSHGWTQRLTNFNYESLVSLLESECITEEAAQHVGILRQSGW
ncbi:hypothetical protein E2C01_063158 [Portunus trituberculatus]|uniref:Uncharacterized protein n=1 Tax=Portunus trituberculatus TaxID=210409 RepID=A0A5B7HHC7_PORTR|nr:hypothetical protein [Portunus trituberculatus]